MQLNLINIIISVYRNNIIRSIKPTTAGSIKSASRESIPVNYISVTARWDNVISITLREVYLMSTFLIISAISQSIVTQLVLVVKYLKFLSLKSGSCLKYFK